jgi:hypothetical protein
MRGVAKEDVEDGPRDVFMRSGGRQLWVTFASEDLQIVVRGIRATKSKVWGGVLVGKMLSKELAMERVST